MSLEQVIEANTSAMTGLTAAILGAQKPPAAGAKPPAGATKPAKPAHSFEEVTTKCIEVKTKCGDKVAQEMIKEHGKAVKLKDVAEANYDALYAAADAAVTDADASDGL